ncbi:MAG TPA: 23S rRNA (uracil(1939)-C(5))-methyltransferase RlmD [Ktedonobacter sp.]|nr:23S rRNA (uracil(1939)-C(5))-methyltransferase RlmD [Ktedonobacter sp.]HCF84644.1 23S rRNA (uracil(1939)-C(5))-methyltransferase RlmD [Ktedonobacter sp.]
MIEHEENITYHTITLGALTREGDAAAEISVLDGEGTQQTQTVRVPAGLMGERVTIAVEAAAKRRPGKRSRRWKPRPPRVWITEIHEASKLRKEAPCPVFGTCGGCQLQHMQYEAQLAWKRSVVERLLREIGGFDCPPLLETVACDDPWHYRNHMRFSVNRNGEPGLTARGTHRVLPLTCCPIADERINRALQVLNLLPNERPQLLIRCGSASGQMLIQPQPKQEVMEKLAVSGLSICTDTLEERLAGETFRIRPSSFFQTNTAQAEKMVQMVVKGLENARTVVDAYCGVGTFALVLAKHVEKVIAIEESASAIKDAQWNLREVHNVEILKGKVEDILPPLAEQIDGLVIDPPRAGCQQVVLDALVRNPVSRVVYVSCEPATLARDLHILCHLHPAYYLQSVQPLDMFPQTAHIESVAILERN